MRHKNRPFIPNIFFVVIRHLQKISHTEIPKEGLNNKKRDIHKYMSKLILMYFLF